MIRHVVLFKFKAGIAAEERKSLYQRLKALPEKVPGVVKPEAGEDFLRTPRSYDIALVFGFESREAMDRYQAHPEHVPVVQRAREICDSIVAVDYEI